jgi:hypothetical protein
VHLDHLELIELAEDTVVSALTTLEVLAPLGVD